MPLVAFEPDVALRVVMPWLLEAWEPGYRTKRAGEGAVTEEFQRLRVGEVGQTPSTSWDKPLDGTNPRGRPRGSAPSPDALRKRAYRDRRDGNST